MEKKKKPQYFGRSQVSISNLLYIYIYREREREREFKPILSVFYDCFLLLDQDTN